MDFHDLPMIRETFGAGPLDMRERTQDGGADLPAALRVNERCTLDLNRHSRWDAPQASPRSAANLKKHGERVSVTRF